LGKFHRLKQQTQTNLTRDVQIVRKQNVRGAEPFKGVQLYDQWPLRAKAHYVLDDYIFNLF